MTENALLSVEEMYRADALAEENGVPSLTLMENAGAAVVQAIAERWPPRETVVLCGPGNNGGDGFVVARLLADAGWPVRLALLGAVENLKGDARANADRWSGDVAPLGVDILDGAELVVDALFGAGLARPVEGAAADVIEAVNNRALACVAVDVPSGVDGDTGAIEGTAPRAQLTVTFFLAKPGHWLMPGRQYSGELVIADIGIPPAVLDDIRPATALNGPALWLPAFPVPAPDGHKYTRGHAVVAGGPEMTGAARLAAFAARRMGAGLVTIAVPAEAFAIYAAGDPGTLVAAVDGLGDFNRLMEDGRKNAVVIGPGGGVSETTRDQVLAALGLGKATVVDADGLTSFADAPQTLFAAIAGPCVLTPHEGEFARLFDDGGSRLANACAAAVKSGAVVVLKGPDTIIAAPDGRTAVNGTGTPYLATAGSGDVLAGMIAGLLAQGMDAFSAAAAAVWCHGAAAELIGPGLIAEDISEFLPAVLETLLNGED